MQKNLVVWIPHNKAFLYSTLPCRCYRKLLFLSVTSVSYSHDWYCHKSVLFMQHPVWSVMLIQWNVMLIYCMFGYTARWTFSQNKGNQSGLMNSSDVEGLARRMGDRPCFYLMVTWWTNNLQHVYLVDNLLWVGGLFSQWNLANASFCICGK
jgi:hypothetical protein